MVGCMRPHGAEQIWFLDSLSWCVQNTQSEQKPARITKHMFFVSYSSFLMYESAVQLDAGDHIVRSRSAFAICAGTSTNNRSRKHFTSRNICLFCMPSCLWRKCSLCPRQQSHAILSVSICSFSLVLCRVFFVFPVVVKLFVFLPLLFAVSDEISFISLNSGYAAPFTLSLNECVRDVIEYGFLVGSLLKFSTPPWAKARWTCAEQSLKKQLFIFHSDAHATSYSFSCNMLYLLTYPLSGVMCWRHLTSSFDWPLLYCCRKLYHWHCSQKH